MDKFASHTGTALPLRRSNVDTDQIIPAVYLKRVTRTGFEDGLFAAWRNDPSFVLNQPAVRRRDDPGPRSGLRYRLVARARGLGAAELRVPGGARLPVRRHLPRQLRQGRAAGRPWSSRRSSRSCGTTSRRTRRTRSPWTWSSGRSPRRASRPTFEIDDYTRWRLMEGLDDIGLTLRHVERSTGSSRPGRRSSRRPCPPRSRASGSEPTDRTRTGRSRLPSLSWNTRRVH